MDDTGYIIYVVDTETTGLDAEENDVIEISASRFKISNTEDVEQKTWYLKALNAISITDEALQINKHKREDILHFTKFGRETYKEPTLIVPEIERWIMSDGLSIMDRVIAGQNIQFDINALQSLWKKVDSPDTFPFSLKNGNRTIDTKMLATIIDLCTGRRRRYYNLSTLVKSFGIKKRKAHRAEDDVAMTLGLLIKMIDPFKKSVANSFQDCYTDIDQ